MDGPEPNTGFFIRLFLAIFHDTPRDKLTSAGKFKAITLKLPKTKRIINNKKVVIGIIKLEEEILMIFASKNIKTITMPTMAAGQKVKPFNKARIKSDNKTMALKNILMAI